MKLPETPVLHFLRERSGNFLYLLSHLVWPTLCPVCGRLGRLVCDGCLRVRTLPLFCLECGAASPCGLHRDGPLCFSGSEYGETERAVVWAMKYKSGRSIARRMGRLLAEAAARPSADFLVPVPLHRGSGRGYNQAELIARGAEEVWNIPVRDVLAWRRELPRQAGKERASERVLPGDAIAAAGVIRPGTTVFLVDDVYTTGSTMRAARDALSRTGARVTGAMVWSRGKSRNCEGQGRERG